MVEPPTAAFRRIAFSMLFNVMIRRARDPFHDHAHDLFSRLLGGPQTVGPDGGNGLRFPGGSSPAPPPGSTWYWPFRRRNRSRSPVPRHFPDHGIPLRSSFPFFSIPSASVRAVVSAARPSKAQPPSMGPPATRMAGTSMRAAAMSMPGTILSQDPRSTTPSQTVGPDQSFRCRWR